MPKWPNLHQTIGRMCKKKPAHGFKSIKVIHLRPTMVSRVPIGKRTRPPLKSTILSLERQSRWVYRPRYSMAFRHSKRAAYSKPPTPGQRSAGSPRSCLLLESSDLPCKLSILPKRYALFKKERKLPSKRAGETANGSKNFFRRQSTSQKSAGTPGGVTRISLDLYTQVLFMEE